MKFSKYLVIFGLAAFSVNVAAVSIATVTGSVVEYDELISSTDLSPSSSANEENWIEQELSDLAGSSVDILYSQNDGVSDGSYWQEVTGAGSVAGDYAFDFGAGNVDYFLIKTGGGSGAGAEYTHYLFENKNSMQWAFVNLSVFGSGVSLTNFDIISHMGTTVPEPGIIGLLAIGLLGVAATRRKKTA